MKNELIIIDDGSNDDSHTIMERYRKHPKVSLIFQENKGYGDALLVGLKTVKTKYFLLCDK